MKLCWLVLLPLCALAQPPADLAAEFVAPPMSAKPWTWWHWMNGNITAEGITRDLEEMKWVGLGGVEIFNVNGGIPDGPIKYFSPEWKQLFWHAIREADRLGLEVCFHNCEGWSSSGGPWVKPEQAMQFVTTAELEVTGGQPFGGQLPQPPTRQDYYRDIAVLAFPTPPETNASRAGATITCSDAKADVKRLLDGRRETQVAFDKPAGQAVPWIRLAFAEPLTVRTLGLTTGGGRNLTRGALAASDDGRTWRVVANFGVGDSGQVLQTIAPTTARQFEFRLTAADSRANRITIAEVELSSGYRLNDLGAKAAFGRGSNPEPIGLEEPPAELVLDPATVVDLTDRLQPDGSLTWTPPAGKWTILRLGHTPTGKTNHPATSAGIGLEVDKLSAEAARAFWRDGIQPLLDGVQPLVGTTFKQVLIDSYEVGGQNWTANFPAEFRARRGYDIRPWLPCLTGRAVASAAASERFLWDFRATVGELFADSYFGEFARLAHERGLELGVEGYGNGPFNDLIVSGRGDVPMGEFWVGQGHASTGKLAASAAHVNGRKYVGAEAFTAAPDKAGWRSHPYALKRLGDLYFADGVNRFIFHRYAHQPWLDKYPGMTMGQWGFHFEWPITWWRQAPAWTGYLARCQALLQAGRFVADALYLMPEGAPVGQPGRDGLRPRLPEGYDWDGCPDETIFRLTVRDGRLTLPAGMSYRLLILPERRTMRPELLRRLRELVLAGATIVGSPPEASPSLQHQPAADREVRALATELWGDLTVGARRVGLGRVVRGLPLEQVLDVPPDLAYEAGPLTRLAWLHRRAGDVDLYFISNQLERLTAVDVTCRASGAPELWSPDTGRIESAPLWQPVTGGTRVSLSLDPYGSVFVVFRPGPTRPAATHLLLDGRPALAASRPPAGRLEIVKAVYGLLDQPDKQVDVTRQARAAVTDGTLILNASNALAGDPAPLVVKDLRVDYVLDGQPGTVTVRENQLITLGVGATLGVRAAAELRVTDAGLQLRAREAGSYRLRRTDGRQETIRVAAPPAPVELTGPWEVRFPAGWGAPDRALFETLVSWPERPEAGIKYFSGTATYVKRFAAPGALLAPDRAAYLDLGRLAVLAEVRLNGQDLGILWRPPYRVEVTGLLRPWDNELEIRVTNLWPNRLIGDDALPPEQRVTFTTWKHWTKDSPLQESGLLGPVELQAATVVELGR